jgi:SAM-dependent methyltransferase
MTQAKVVRTRASREDADDVVAQVYLDRNRETWNRVSDGYQKDHNGFLCADGMAWGLWQAPESQVKALGDVQGKDTLEVGCGGGQCSIALARAGARPVGVDMSGQQLVHAKEHQAAAGVDFQLIEANVETIPLPDASFDIVFCDHGALTYADPHKSIPEMARLLRPGGLLAFNISSVFRDLCWDNEANQLGDRLTEDYFDLFRFHTETVVAYQLTYGGWIRLFRENGFVVEDLIELRPPADATTTYPYVSKEWARRFPVENIWKVRKAA